MRSYISVSLKLSVVMSVTIAIVTSILCADILQMMRTPENIFEGAYAYLLVTFIGVPFTFFYNLLSSIIRALGDSKTPFWFLLLSTVLNIVLDLFCILVLGWGVAGAAIATVIAQFASCAFAFCFLIGKKVPIRITLLKKQSFSPVIVQKILTLGISPFLILATDSVIIIVLNSVLQKFGGPSEGDILITCATIVQSFMMLITGPMLGISSGTQQF